MSEELSEEEYEEKLKKFDEALKNGKIKIIKHTTVYEDGGIKLGTTYLERRR